jgi:hypothetical protein
VDEQTGTTGKGKNDTKLKPIREQVVVIAGGSSGIGRETALRSPSTAPK